MKKTLLLAAGLLMACGKKVVVEDHYYSLVLEAAEGRAPTDSSELAVRVDLIEVVLPDFLMSRSLARQISSNEVAIARHHYWTEPLDEGVRQVLVWDLSDQLPKINVTQGPGRDADCTLTVEFDRLHASHDARVLVSGQYTFVNNGHVIRREFNLSEPLQGDGYTNAVSAMRRALALLSEEMSPMVQRCTPKFTEPADTARPEAP